MKKFLLISIAALMFGCSDSTDTDKVEKSNEPQEEVETVEETKTSTDVKTLPPVTEQPDSTQEDMEFPTLLLNYRFLFQEKRDIVKEITTAFEDDVLADNSWDNKDRLGEMQGNIIAISVISNALEEMKTSNVIPEEYTEAYNYLVLSVEEMNNAGILLMNIFTENGVDTRFYKELNQENYVKNSYEYLEKHKDAFYGANSRD